MANFDIEFVRNIFKQEGYQILSDKYKNNQQKLYFICPNGHKYFIQFGSWRSGRRCAICAGRRVDINFVQSTIRDAGYVMLDTYIGSNKKIKMICPKNHKCSITWDNFKQGHRCGKCKGQTSKFELKLYEEISKKYNDIKIMHKDRKIIKPYEIDIAIPKYKIAIEYNGAGHHLPIYGNSERVRIANLKKVKKIDSIKKEMLRDMGWCFFYIDDKKSFNDNTFDRAFNFLTNNIDKVIRANTETLDQLIDYHF